MKWTKQPGAGLVMICESVDEAFREMGIAGCVDCTKAVKDGIMEEMKAQGSEPDEYFEWEDNRGDVYWHVTA